MHDTNSAASKPLWASRFKKDIDQLSKTYTESVTVDRPMTIHSIWGSQVHATMLAKQGILTDEQCRNILQGLEQIKEEFNAGKWDLPLAQEDAQMGIESRLIELTGMENGGRMHVTRSRNDQVPFDTALYTREQLDKCLDAITKLIDVILERAKEHVETIAVGHTHVQQAMILSYGFILSSHACSLQRCFKRILQARDDYNFSPLGASAIAGNSMDTDREFVADLTGFDGVQDHAHDAISNHDNVLSIVSALTILYTQYSRMAEDLILSCSTEFSTITLSDAFAMGSSMMPNKKNPGCIERVRGNAGIAIGNLMNIFTAVKGTPVGYNRDCHSNKTVLEDIVKLVIDTTKLLSGVFKSIEIHTDRMLQLANASFATATEFANYLVQEHNIPFRETHHIVGGVVGDLAVEKKTFLDKERTKELLSERGIEITDADYDAYLTPTGSLYNYRSSGSANPEQTKQMIANMEKDNTENKSLLRQRLDKVNHAHSQARQIVDLIVDQQESVQAAVDKVCN